MRTRPTSSTYTKRLADGRYEFGLVDLYRPPDCPHRSLPIGVRNDADSAASAVGQVRTSENLVLFPRYHAEMSNAVRPAPGLAVVYAFKSREGGDRSRADPPSLGRRWHRRGAAKVE